MVQRSVPIDESREGITFTPPSSVTSVAHVDRLISRVAEVQRQLRSARNALLPINCLPAELLSTIFLLLQSPPRGYDDTEPTFFAPPIRNWYKVTHVCRHWRAVAIACRLLWTQLDLDAGKSWVGRMLARAGNAPLTVRTYVKCASEDTMQALQMAVSRLDRVHSLHLAVDGETFERTFSGPLVAEAELPRLRSVAISRASSAGGSVNIPRRLFHKGAPHLEYLTFEKCSIVAWDMLLLFSCPRLKVLRLSKCAPNVPTLPQLLQILGGMPLLEGLHLIGVLPVIEQPAITTPMVPVISLPKLNTLALDGGALDLVGLLSHLDLSAGVTMSIRCSQPTTLPELSLICSAISALPLPCDEPPTVERGMSIKATATEVRIHTATVGVPPPFPSWADFGEQGSLLLTVQTVPGHACNAIKTLAQSLPMYTVTSLGIAADLDHTIFDRNALQTLLAASFNVTTLKVCGAAGTWLPRLLSLPPLPSSARSPELHKPPLLPVLGHLVLSAIDFGWTAGSADFLDLLQEAQFQRCEGSRPIAELTIDQCRDVGADEVRVLCQLFAEVHWDGFAGGELDDEGSEEEETWDGMSVGTVGWHS